MLIIKPDSMPRLWWLFPWSYARQLYRNANALKALCDRQDDLLRSQTTTRPRWSIWISGLPGPERKYLFVDNDGKCENRLKGVHYGTPVHFYDGAFTSFKDPEDAIIFCDRLNKGEVK
jgi:hypothetical protein